ncbi:MAG TPA: CopG family transcriptional regulator [Vicinamibacterales bacterium]
MKRTTIYFDGDLELRLKAEVQRRKQPMAEIVREAIEAYLTQEPSDGPPGAGAFSSGRNDTAGDVDAALAETGFGKILASRERSTVQRAAKRRR